jgi:hypothetical protein
MAEINIQRKSSSSALWWVLAIVGVIIIAWALFAWTGRGTGTGTGTGATGPGRGVMALEAAPPAFASSMVAVNTESSRL